MRKSWNCSIQDEYIFNTPHIYEDILNNMTHELEIEKHDYTLFRNTETRDYVSDAQTENESNNSRLCKEQPKSESSSSTRQYDFKNSKSSEGTLTIQNPKEEFFETVEDIFEDIKEIENDLVDSTHSYISLQNNDGSLNKCQTVLLKDNLHNVIPLPFEPEKQVSNRKRVTKNINSRNKEWYNMCYDGYYECFQTSTSKVNLSIHSCEKSYKCKFCSYECRQRLSLKMHLRIHGEKPYKCDTCSYEFSCLSHLKRHLRIHTGEKPYKCNSCSFECSRLSSLKRHLKIHTGEKPYKCNFCSYESSHLSNLKNHSRIHTGEKPYKCNSCSYECSESSKLKRHLRIHTGEKPYKCNSCSFECSQLSNLKTHSRIHTGEKPYKCNM